MHGNTVDANLVNEPSSGLYGIPAGRGAPEKGRCPIRALMERRQSKPLAYRWLSLMKSHTAGSKALAWQTKLAQTSQARRPQVWFLSEMVEESRGVSAVRSLVFRGTC